ncbi:hypothetical protein C0993_004572, partial [Termitomyces sp. T159_Od127]
MGGALTTTARLDATTSNSLSIFALRTNSPTGYRSGGDHGAPGVAGAKRMSYFPPATSGAVVSAGAQA